MSKIVGLVIVCLALAGCARGPASCDGTDKRVMNDGKWDGEMSLGCGGIR